MLLYKIKKSIKTHISNFFLPAKNMHEEREHGLAPLTSLEEPQKEVLKDDLYKYSCARLCWFAVVEC